MLVAINYHYIRFAYAGPEAGIHGFTPAQFEAQLDTLSRLGEFVSAEQVRDAVRGKKPLPAKSILLTFDNGLREQFENAWTILYRHSIPAIFFVNTSPIVDRKVQTVHKIHLLSSHLSFNEFRATLTRHAHALDIPLDLHEADARAVMHYRYDMPEVAVLKYTLNFRLEREDRRRLIDACFGETFHAGEARWAEELYMNGEHIRHLGRYGFIGSQGHEHMPLSLLPACDAEAQVLSSLAHLEKLVGYRPYALSYPHGSPTLWVEHAAARMGIDIAFTLGRTVNENLSRPLRIARFDCNDLPGGKRPLVGADALFETEAVGVI